MRTAGKPTLLLTAVVTATGLLSGCGGSGQSLVVAVENSAGLPLRDVTVAVVGTGRRATTDQSGNARFSGLQPGSYDVKVSAAGYYTHREQTVHVPTKEPLDLTLNYAPPLGVFVSHPGTYEWDELIVTRTGERLITYRWACKPVTTWHLVKPKGNWSPYYQSTSHRRGRWEEYSTNVDPTNPEFAGLTPIGPGKLDSSWSRGTPPGDVTGWIGTVACKPRSSE